MWMRVRMRMGMRGSLAAFPIEMLLNIGILLRRLDLFHFQGDAQALGEIALGDGEVAGAGVSGVEMLVIPVERRRYNRSRLPVQLHRVRVLQMILVEQGEALSVESENNSLVRIPVAELVRANLEVGPVRLSNWF